MIECPQIAFYEWIIENLSLRITLLFFVLHGSRKKAHWKKAHRKQAHRKKAHAEKSARGIKRSRKKAQIQLF